jgi:hypothetical protein
MKSKAISVVRGLVMSAAFVSAAVLCPTVASGQVPEPKAEGRDTSQESDNKRLLADMRRLADTVQVTTGRGAERKEVPLIPGPLFRFSDRKRFITDGTIWAWGIEGRPILMAEFHTGDRLKPLWGQWLVATSDVPVEAVIAGHGRWATGKLDFKLLHATDMGAPADTEAGRLRQMKRLARSLSASSQWQGQQFELRLLETEVYRYSQPKSGLVDGAAFVFAVDSNPEAILFVEAHASDTSKGAPGSWKYTFARMSAASLSFRRGDTEVWSVPRSVGRLHADFLPFERTVPASVDGSD